MSKLTGTVSLHRVFRAPIERAYRAFIDSDARCKWTPPHGFTAKMLASDLRVGGNYRMEFTNFTTQQKSSFGGTYVELKPNECISYTDKFDDPNLPGEMTVNVTFRPVACGTEIAILQTGIPTMIPVEMCYLGWQESLAQLATLIEPEIP